MATETLSAKKQEQLPPKQVNWRSQLNRFVLVVDGQIKSSFTDEVTAENEARRLRERWSILNFRVDDRGEPAA